MSEFLQKLVEGKIDFEGQKRVERIARDTLIASTAISFLAGFALQSLRVTFGLFALSVIVLSLCRRCPAVAPFIRFCPMSCLNAPLTPTSSQAVVPPWPVYNRHPVAWLPAKETKTE
ncbi:hypothetical protein BC628DRAFT_1393734 [Trametes gibbosa]|nr:hypothetical protein BC628DRAFT_1393734 [Trametes gibbosa]